jgi:hypothetical protein
MRMREIVAGIAVIMVCAAGAALGQNKQTWPADKVVHFAVIGDRTGDHQPGVYEEAVAEIERLRPDFVVTVGDMIEGYSQDTVLLNKQWDEYFKIVKPFTTPVYFTPGNHDITYSAQEPVYRERVGEPYHSFDVDGIHFVSLDVSRWEASDQLPKEQLDWLTNDLVKNQSAAYKIVIFHKPFWYNSLASGKPDTLHSLFVKYGVNAVFNGHFHQYFSATYDGIKYTTFSSSGGGLSSDSTGLGYSFGWVTADSSGLHINPIKLGSVMPWDYSGPAEMQLIDSITQRGLEFESWAPVDDQLKISGADVKLRLVNYPQNLSVNDTLRWEAPPGWTIEPQAVPISLGPGQTGEYVVKVSCAGNLYPVPSVTAELPYSEDRFAYVTKELPVARQVNCVRATSKPKIDGNLNDAIWRNPVTAFFSPAGEAVKIESTFCYFAYDRNNLYLAARCRESDPDKMKMLAKERDGAVTGDDCVGYFFQPDIAADTVYQIYFNPLGTVFDQKISRVPTGYFYGDRRWNGTYEVKTGRDAGYWYVEARIPLKQLGVSAEKGMKWRLNFLRKQQHLGSAADWQAPIDYDPKSFGMMVME